MFESRYLFLSMAITAPTWADSSWVLDPLTVKASYTSAPWVQAPLAVTSIDARDKSGEAALSLDHLLNGVPGTYTQSHYNMAQGMRLSIRGFGARSSFGVRGIRVLVDGVPLTMPDGQTELDGVDYGLVEGIEVIRGPASSLAGNAAGGVLAIRTREPGDEPGSRLEVGGGELGYRRVRAETSGSLGDLAGLLAFSSTTLDGYREHGRAESGNLTAKLRWQAEAGRLGLTLHALDNRSEDPGSLTLQQVREDRAQARPQSLTFDSDERIRQQRLALVWDGQGQGEDEYQLRSYLGQRVFGNRLPLRANGQTSYDRQFAGVAAQYTHRARWFGLGHSVTGGVELEGQRDARDRHNNLNGLTGALTQRQDEKADALGIFLEDRIALGERWLVTLGMRHDRVLLAVDDRFLSDGDDSGERTLQDWSHSLGLSYRLDDHHHLYTRLATSFETPTVNELANPAGGGFNPNLQPARALNREIGLKGEWSRLRYEAALYRIDLDDELVPYVDGRTFYRNVGKSRREGLELSLDWFFADAWRVSAAYTYSDYRFIEFAGNQGNALPGVPRQTLFGELAYEGEQVYARVNMNSQDRLYVDNGNTESVPGTALFNLRFGLRLNGQGQVIEPYAGIDNLTNRRYYDNLRINDSGGRYYEPGPGRTFFTGLKILF